MRIYLDVCCLNRPFDDQTIDRNYMESRAISIILTRMEDGEWKWISSEVVNYEINKTPDTQRIQSIKQLTGKPDEYVCITRKIIDRAKVIERLGFEPFDAMHIACAEHARADVLLTTDDKLIRKSQQTMELDVRISNPLSWLREGYQNED